MLRTRFCFCALCSVIGLALAALYFFLGTPRVSVAQPKKGGQISYINDIAPIFKKNCFGCHDAKKKKGKLELTNFEAMLKGGRHENVVVPGKSKESFLMDVLTATDNSRMPPKEVGNPLPKDQIELIAAWINQGAKLDMGIDAKADIIKELQKRFQPPTLLASYSKPVVINSVAFTPDSQKLIASGYHELTIWDIGTGKLEKRLHTRAERAHDLEFLPDGKLVVAGGRPGQEGDVRIYDINGKSKIVNGVAVLDGVNDKSVLVAELLSTGDEILTLDVSDDGKKIAAAGCDQTIRVWDISGGYTKAKLEHSVENHADWVLSVNFSPNGQYLVTGSRDKSAKVWDLKAKESLVTFPGHAEPVFGAVLQADGKAGISAGADKQIRWWNAQEKSKDLGKAIRNVAAAGKALFKLVEYRKDNKQILATCSADGSVKTFEADKGTALKTFTGLKDWVYALAISPDGKLIAAGSWDGEVRVWKMDDASLVKGFNASPGYEAPKVQAGK